MAMKESAVAVTAKVPETSAADKDHAVQKTIIVWNHSRISSFLFKGSNCGIFKYPTS